MSENFNLTSFENNKDIVIEEEGIKYTITSADNQRNKINEKNMTTINFEKCENELKNNKYIHENSTLYILKIDKEESFMKIPKIEYEIFVLNQSNILNSLNISICKGINIEMYIPINISKDEYDKYDIKSGFYKDICYTYTSEKGIDVSLSDRKKEFLNNNMTLCEEDCDLENYDANIGKVRCNCLTKIKIPLISEISFDKNKLKNKFMDIKSLININIIKCYHLFKKKFSFLKNIGFILISPIFIFYLVSLFIFYYKELKIINKYIDDIVSLRLKKEEKLNKKNPPRKKNLRKKNNLISAGSTNKKEKTKLSNSKHKIKSNNFSIKYKIMMKRNVTQLNNLSYKEAKRQDKRGYFQYYRDLIIYKNLILFTFFVKNDYNPKIMKILLLLSILEINFGINGLFFNDSTMHKIYEDNGKYNLLYQIPQILYSSFLSLFLKFLLNILALSEKDVLNVKNADIKNLDKISYYTKLKIRKKSIFFFIISLIIIVFFWYYLACFCIVFKNTQIYLLKDTLISFGTSLITPLFISLLPGIFRIPALKSKNRECFFIFSKIIQIF